MQGDKYSIDMCSGPIFSKIILFSVPLILSGILQLMFNAADLIVLGRFASPEAMAAVGATAFLTNLIVNVFIGLSIGTNVLAANYLGAKNWKNTSRTVHTAIAVSLAGGVALAVIGILISKPLLEMMSTPDDIIGMATLYMWIYCAGLPFILLYNFGSAVMRAAGDTRRPLFYLVIAGIVNVILNIVFVLGLHIDVAGVAIATTVSQAISAFLVLRNLIHLRDACRFRWKNLHIDPIILKSMLWIGLPAGIQGSFFSISNLVIQSSINSFGAMAIAGTTAALSLEGIVYAGAYSYHQTVITFAGQNIGAGRVDRVKKSIWYCLICSIALETAMGLGFYLCARPVLSIFNTNPEVISWGILRMKILFTTYALCGIMDVVSGALRGLGSSLQPAIVTMLGVCVLRVVWVFCVFPLDRTMENLLISYPVSWFLTAAVNAVFLWILCRRVSAQRSPALA